MKKTYNNPTLSIIAQIEQQQILAASTCEPKSVETNNEKGAGVQLARETTFLFDF